MFFLLILQTALAVELFYSSLSGNYTLGSNLLANPSLDLTILNPNNMYQFFPNFISGWNCTNECEVQKTNTMCTAYGLSCNVTWKQAFDLDPQGSYPNITQEVKINTSGSYLLHLEWMPPFYNSVGKSFAIDLNSSNLANIRVQSFIYTSNIEEYIINLTNGTLLLTIRMTGMTGISPDMSGVVVSNFRLQQLVPIPPPSPVPVPTPTPTPAPAPTTIPFSDPAFQSLISSIVFNNLTMSLNSVPGNRIFMYTLMNFLSTFDRLQFYYYHKQNLSYYSYILLSNVNSLALEKGDLPQSLIESWSSSSSICASIAALYDQLIRLVDYKKDYSDSSLLEKNSLGIGFWANNLDFFYYQMPVLLLIYLLLSLTFRLLFNYRVSLLFRKYSFYGLLILIVYEGNMEQFSFYFFSECENLFSASLSHKLSNTFMLFFFFLAVVFAIGGLIWFKVYYRKLVKYFTEEYTKVYIYLLVLESLQKSIFPLLFGCIHALLLDNLSLQTIALGVVEVGYFYTKLVNQRALAVKFKLKIVLLSATSLLRMGFIVTLFLFEVKDQPEVINLIHHDLVCLYLISWLLDSLYEVVLFLLSTYEQVKKPCKQIKVFKAKDINTQMPSNREEPQRPVYEAKNASGETVKIKVMRLRKPKRTEPSIPRSDPLQLKMVTILKKKDVSVLPRKNGENIEKNKARVEFEPDHNIFFAAEEKEPRLKRRLQRTIK